MYIDKCNICGEPVSTKFELPFKEIYGMTKQYTQKIGVCQKCGLIFTQNPFGEELLANRYKHQSKFEFDDENNIFEDSNEYKKRCARQHHFLEENIAMFEGIIEVGASSGYNLSLYRDKRVLGIEPSECNCRNAKKKYNIDMFAGTFDEYLSTSKDDKFDLVFLSHTLEHIVGPYDFLRNCKDKFNNNYFFIEVPAFDFKHKEEPFGMFCEEHVNYFTLEALNSLLNKLGYVLKAAELIYNFEEHLPAGWPAISTIWQKSDSICDSNYKLPIARSDMILEQYIGYSKSSLKAIDEILIQKIPRDEKIAVWGTGHHVSMLLANTGLYEKNIVKYYDSDKRKSSVIFNGKPITAFDPEDIMKMNLNGILIGSYVFQDTIYDLLKPYSNLIKIYKLY